MTRGLRFPLLLVAAAAATAGCDYVQDRFRDCRHLRIDLINDVRNGPSLNMTLEPEAYAQANLVAPGATRQVEVCAERGDRKRFRVGQNDYTLDIANCVVSRDPHEYEFTVSRVLWDGHRLLCENW
jgi:hypothetical protein